MYEPTYGNASTWSQWGDELVGPQIAPALKNEEAKYEEGDRDHGRVRNHRWHHVAVVNLSGTNIGTVLYLFAGHKTGEHRNGEADVNRCVNRAGTHRAIRGREQDTEDAGIDSSQRGCTVRR